ncbi:hypothetical protein [Gluconacetobacter diazotrophicus]|nr:hypothetical protein [Gluconacetobacter diazotrophicus]
MIHPAPPLRVFTVASAAQIRAVLAALRAGGGEDAASWALLSPPDAGCFMGPAWWRALLAETGAGLPAYLDCGASAGRAVEALGLGLRHIVLHASCPQGDTVRLLAASLGATCLDRRPGTPCPPVAFGRHAV